LVFKELKKKSLKTAHWKTPGEIVQSARENFISNFQGKHKGMPSHVVGSQDRAMMKKLQDELSIIATAKNSAAQRQKRKHTPTEEEGGVRLSAV